MLLGSVFDPNLNGFVNFDILPGDHLMNEVFQNAQSKKRNNRADVDHAERRDHPAKYVEVRIGIISDKLHKAVLLQIRNPRPDDPSKQHDVIGLKQ